MPAATKTREKKAATKRSYKSVPDAVEKYIGGLRTADERSFASKEWRVLTGERGTHATPPESFAEGRATSIRTRLSELAEGGK